MSRLSDQEIERLDGYLAEHCEPAGGLASIESLDGFLSAVVVGPEPIQLGEWMDFVWGPDHAFADQATAGEMVALLMRAYNAVVDRVADPASADEPTGEVLPLVAVPSFDADEPGEVLDPDDTSIPVGAAWSYGFLLGRELREAAWEDRVDDFEGLDDALMDIDDLMLGVGEPEPDAGPEDEPLTLEERLQVVQGIPGLLHTLYQDVLEQAAPPPEPYRRESPKVGRNDPCPCGSGRKYKLCHGGN